jgi:hypothetical protein
LAPEHDDEGIKCVRIPRIPNDVGNVFFWAATEVMDQPHCEVAIVVLKTKPNRDTFGIVIDHPHLPGLEIAFGDIALVYTECIHPED